MQTIYVYLSEAGWVWFAVAGTYLAIRLAWRKVHDQTALKTVQEADHSHEQ